MDQPSSADDSGITLRIKFKSESVDAFIARYGADVSPGGTEEVPAPPARDVVSDLPQ